MVRKYSYKTEFSIGFIKGDDNEKKNKGFLKDERIWTPAKPSGSVTKTTHKIRFLPPIDNKNNPYVHTSSHWFKSPITGEIVSEPCPSSISKPCPICQHSYKLYSSGDPTDKNLSSGFYKKRGEYANILVIKESSDDRKSNEGKVFMFRFGKKIEDKIKAVCSSVGEGEAGIDIFHPDTGLDFNLSVTLQGEFQNYDLSDFSRTTTPIAKTDAEIDNILDCVYDLKTEWLSESKFKSYEKLKDIVDRVIIGGKSAPIASSIPSTPTTGASEETKSKLAKKEKEIASVKDIDDDELIKSLEEELGVGK